MDVLLIDDQPLCLDTLTDLIAARYAGVRLRCASSLAEASPLLEERLPALIIADMAIPDIDAAAGLQLLIERAKPCPVLALDARANQDNLERAFAAGAKGYITKTSTRDLIEAAIALVAAGGSYFPHAMNGANLRPKAVKHPLSNRQIEVLKNLMKGKSNRDIAEDLGITVATVKLHVHAILSATGARNRTEAAIRAREYMLRS